MTSLAAGRRPGRAASVGLLAERLLDLGARSHGAACALLVVLSLVCFLPGFASLQPMDRDEPRFAQASKQMLESGDLVDIRFQGEARHKKPVGIYWAQSAVVAAGEALGVPGARTAIWLYRIPSLVGAVATVLLSYWAALAFLPRRGAFLAAALVGASVMLSAEARLAKTDALLTACAVAAMGALARAWLARATAARLPQAPLNNATVLTFWLAVALGILVKGPMVPLFAGLAALSLSVFARSGAWLKRLRPGLGLVLVLILVAPWFVAITLKSGGAFYGEAVGHDMLGKVGTAQTQHWAPPGTYLLVIFATFWPAAAFAAMALPFAWTNRREDGIAFLIAWVLPSWLVFEAVPTKLPHYVLPLCTALAILAVTAVARGAVHRDRPGARWVALLVPFIPAGLTAGLCVAAWRLDGTIPWAGLPLLLAASAVAFLAWRAFVGGSPERALAVAVLAGALLGPAVFGLTQPALPALKVSPRLASLRDALPCPNPKVGTLGYREPSLVFLIGTDLAMLDSAEEAAAFLRQGGCRLVYVEDRFAPAFAAAHAGIPPQPVGRVTGFNINGGKPVGLSAYAVTP
ncbi:4-amino-4-deoxy-L-arabinose transferase [Methylobacterium sp. 174MFSha1.1]|uniref:ArnT family glycosyltransferase n=1 Tax=Methylobacterium sp. 174MFSha1.1 TaxID=1502749 RepID=UPI0008E56FE9|nr:glycosyltransferase family 39 protein [Methylobacterium sp. 174MFSha1.1]SFU40107.1 4-amino-4-deoxy-L-arabinose transferase [Methylobacterium sp. 174MFSha1.1]